MSLFRLPDYEVLIHIRYNAFGKKLEQDILQEMAAFNLDESAEYQGVKDYHWAFESWSEATAAGERLRRYVDNPNLLVLRVKANYDESIETISHKDLIGPKPVT